MCYHRASPRSLFITWLAILNRLYTADRLQAWGIQCSDIFVLCSVGKESVEHLFFECSFSAAVWKMVLLQLGIQGSRAGFGSDLDTMVKKCRKTGGVDQLYVMCFNEAIYSIWLTRNAIIFKKTVRRVERIAKDILFRVCCRSSEELRNSYYTIRTL